MEQHNHQLLFNIIATLYSVACILIVLYYTPRRHKKMNNTLHENNNIQSGVIQYTCPNCHQQVNNGFATMGRGVMYLIEDLK